MLSRKNAFTLVELLIVVLILAALASIAVPRMVSSADKAKINACQTNVNLINRQAELYMSNKAQTSVTLTNLFADPNYFPDGTPVCPFGTAYTIGTNNHVSGHVHGN